MINIFTFRLLYIFAFIIGHTVLVIEILSSRVLGPIYGMGVHLWACILSSTLGALAIGHYLGGKLSLISSGLIKFFLPCLLICSWFFAMPFFIDGSFFFIELVSFKLSALLSSTLLVGPVLLLLGSLTPIIISFLSQSNLNIGPIVGKINCIGTIGSVIGALLVSFYGIPYLKITQIYVIHGVLWFMVTAVVSVHLMARQKKIVIAFILPLLAYLMGTAKRDINKQRVVKNTLYSQISYENNKDYKTLYLNNFPQTILNKKSNQSYIAHTHLITQLICSNSKRDQNLALIIGLGAGALVRDLKNLDFMVDAVEIDPEVVQFARKYFPFLKDDDNVVVNDGRRYIQSYKGDVYDLVVVDAYNSSTIPFHLTSLEAFRSLKNIISKNGMVIINLLVDGYESKIIDYLASTAHEVFPVVKAYPTWGRLEQGNVILVASFNPIELKNIPYKGKGLFSYQVVQFAAKNQFTPKTNPKYVLTDNKNPIDIISDEINYSARIDFFKIR